MSKNTSINKSETLHIIKYLLQAEAPLTLDADKLGALQAEINSRNELTVQYYEKINELKCENDQLRSLISPLANSQPWIHLETAGTHETNPFPPPRHSPTRPLAHSQPANSPPED